VTPWQRLGIGYVHAGSRELLLGSSLHYLSAIINVVK